MFLTRDHSTHGAQAHLLVGGPGKHLCPSPACHPHYIIYYTHTHTPYTPIKTSPTIKTTTAETTLAYSS